MTASIVLKDYKVLESQKEDDVKTIAEAVKAIQSEYVNYFYKPQKDYKLEYRKILAQTTMSLKKCANSNFKVQPSIEMNEIEHIKMALGNFAKDDEKIKNFKKEIINDLTEFQQEVDSKHTTRLADLRKKQKFYARKAAVLEVEKNKLIMDRLSKILWPYDKKTKEYENESAKYKLLAQNYTQKINEARLSKPSANEKDLLIYQMKLKEKYSELF